MFIHKRPHVEKAGAKVHFTDIIPHETNLYFVFVFVKCVEIL